MVHVVTAMVCTGVVCILVAAHCPCTYSFPKNAMLLVLGIFCLLFFSCFFAEYHCTRLYCNMYVQIRVPKPLPSACFQPKTLLTQCPFCSNHRTSARGKELSQLSQLPLSSSSSCFSSTSNRRSPSIGSVAPAEHISPDVSVSSKVRSTVSRLRHRSMSFRLQPVRETVGDTDESSKSTHWTKKAHAYLSREPTRHAGRGYTYKLQRQHGPRTWASPAGPCQALCAWLTPGAD